MRRVLVIGWTIGVVVFLALLLYPISTRTLRLAELVMAAGLWSLLPVLFWKSRAACVAWSIFTAMGMGVLLWPDSGSRDPARVRNFYLSRLQAFSGAPYVWGGENRLGIDCSGLVRKALVEALWLQGVTGFDPGAVREACRLWWNDATAADLGSTASSQTARVGALKNLRDTRALELLPGDLAVTAGGVHVLAYLGGGRWINADPMVGAVQTLDASAPGGGWLDGEATWLNKVSAGEVNWSQCVVGPNCVLNQADESV